ncbi:glycosyltransferase family 2 protein [Phragmitibacter flavus]|uniref:Glycosyltransferase family 2 protein n=1 Tax=Phragmitibacter flavus TaxID=2576071 RepID=A0A5R8KFU3_9BACT|nr:glycosyltransferase family 2 protein [Phragmitibacter flavus]TLD70459.1 glycosyltransferase family 2 protein [Phragmitibacter flavus]
MSERIAVIIPCYNHAAYIGAAIESVLAQSRRADRILVIDDGSKDGSEKVVMQYLPHGVEMWGRENRGAHCTLNELVRQAAKDCEFVQILNSDDRLLPDRLEFCLQKANQFAAKSVFATGLQVIDGAGQIMPPDAPRARWFHGAWSLGQQDGITLQEWLGQANFVATTTNVFARTEYLLGNPFRPYRYNHDYFFLATAALENQLSVDPAVHVEYRVHGSNTIATKPAPLMREMLRLHLDLYRTHAAALRERPSMRHRFFDFVRGSCSSISSLHEGMLQVALAQLITSQSDEQIELLCAGLNGPEFEVFPNHTLAGAYDGKNNLNAGVVLGKRLETLKEEMVRVKLDRDSLEKIARCRQKLLKCPWVRFGLFLGIGRPLTANMGKNVTEKLLYLSTTCRNHWWLRLGAKLRFPLSRELREGDY